MLWPSASLTRPWSGICIGTIELSSSCFKKITAVKLCISNSLWTTYITENSSYHKFLDTVGPVQRVQQWHTYPTWPSTTETPHKDLKTVNKCRNLWMSSQSTSVPSVTAELLQNNKRAACLTLKKPTRATNYKKILVRSSIFVRDSLLLLKLNCD